MTEEENDYTIEVADRKPGGVLGMNRLEVEEMLKKDRREWELLSGILDAHPGESLHDPATPEWDSRDVYAHLARWNEHSNSNIKSYCSGRSLTELEGTDEEINASWLEEDRDLSLEEARDKALKAFEKRIRIIRAVPQDRWDEKLEEIVFYDGWKHYSTHRGYLRFKR
ncbi:MAG: maleylpyruvate isomerase N-terminal domain-containing protein [Dehalococcoidales bacterium]|nr:maleylpyruvate isomerase N-terminal domain-containing protein [Dehalococcoidales bacterium]